MNNRVKVVYRAAIEDRKFLAAIKSADDDNPPHILSSNAKKAIFASIYYGWCVAKYGNEWAKTIPNLMLKQEKDDDGSKSERA